MKKPQPLHTILDQTLKGLELDVPMKAYSIWSAWQEIMGAAVALQTRPRAIRNHILFIDVSHSTWMQQLQFLKPTLLEKINGFLGETLIEDIRFKVGKIPQTATPLPEKKEEKLDRQTLNRIEQLVEKITDGDVRKGFQELLIKSAVLEQSRKKSKKEG
jgi:hypothetical protein